MSESTWPVLYSKGSNGELRQWQVSTLGGNVVVEHGVVGGAKVTSSRSVTAKNVGKKNETTVEEQATIEAQAEYTHKIERKYSLTPEGAQERLTLPMLAQYLNKQKKVTYPVDIQPKLDGNRAIARWQGDKVVLISRGGKEWLNVQHINRALEAIIPKDFEFDGEIYLHGKNLQWISSKVKKFYPGETDTLQFYVYDVPVVAGDESLTWGQRCTKLDVFHIQNANNPVIKFVNTLICETPEQVKLYHDDAVKDGYEGAMVRLLHGTYEPGVKSSVLLKVKEFDDAEYEIVGFKSEDINRVNSDGTQITIRAVVWECRNDLNDLTFETRPRGTYEERAELFASGQDYIGQKLTVRFFGRTDLGKPNLPIGHAIRLNQDIS